MKKRKQGLSIIVPIYNVEKYLKDCVESMVNQKKTKLSYEILLINDGSTDLSREIAKDYEKNYPDIIKYYEKKNGGLSDARNYGFEKSNFEYIWFVDSDDWIEIDSLYELEKEIKTNPDIIMMDYVSIQDGWKSGIPVKIYYDEDRTKSGFLKNITAPAFACGRVFRYQLLDQIKFPSPDLWYEDVATVPILTALAEKFNYLEKPLYYYRQRENSITTRQLSSRNLEIIQGWERIFSNTDKKYHQELAHAVYLSIVSFMRFRPKFIDDYLSYFKKNIKKFKNNPMIEEYLEHNNTALNLFEFKPIPKKLHYFWFGPNEKSEMIKSCIESWKKYAPEYEIIEWNENNCDVQECQYVKEAYEAKKWAFVSDYFRTKKVYEHGGIYVDTDMEFMKEIDELRVNSAFFQFETNNVAAGMFGAYKMHPIIKDWYESYLKSPFKIEENVYNTETIVVRLTKILENKYQISYNCDDLYIGDNITIYGPDVLLIDVYNGKNIAVHHYDASWWDVKTGTRSYKYDVLEYYFLTKNKAYSYIPKEGFIQKIVYNGKKLIFDTSRKVLKKLLSRKNYNFLKSQYRKIKPYK